jgi:hypothetical protein
MADEVRGRRRWERHVPAHAVRVAAESEAVAGAVGEALNLSDGGACLALRTSDLVVGDEVILRLTFGGPAFAGPRRPLPATARVVWARGSWGRTRYGIEWTHQGPQRSWIGWLTKV